jgi:hypothetical protein
MLKTTPWTLEPARDRHSGRAREAAADVLRSASALLARLALRLRATEHAATVSEPVLEFYAEAGAPEGALYVDGRRVGVLPGVTRL